MELLGQKLCASVILINIAKLPSIKVITIYILIRNVWECPFPASSLILWVLTLCDHFAIFANIIGKKWFFSILLTCICHIMRKVEHPFTCWISSIFAFVCTIRSYLLPIFIRSGILFYWFVVALCKLEKLVLSPWYKLQIFSQLVTCLFFFFWPQRAVCRILIPWPGIEPRPWHWKLRFLTTGTPGNSLSLVFLLNLR